MKYFIVDFDFRKGNKFHRGENFHFSLSGLHFDTVIP